MTARTAAGLSIALVALVFMVAEAGRPGAEAAHPGENGRIAYFVANEPGGFAIQTMNPDGSDGRIVDGTETNIEIPWGPPEWSPDGSEIVYFASRFGPVDGIRVAAADGSGVSVVPNSAIGALFPTWSPDGSMIAFATLTEGGWDLYTIGADGTDMRQVTNTPRQIEWHIDWSPSGEQIAFATLTGPEWDLHVVNVDGTNEYPLMVTPTVSEVRPSWSPDGEQIIYERDDDLNHHYQIARVDADGGNFTALTGTDQKRGQPSFSPDGERIVFGYGATGIGVMDADGGNEVRLTEDGGYNPDWGTRPVTTPADVTWGDNNCSGDVNPVDSLLVLRFDAQLPAETSDCPQMGEAVGIAGSSRLWGDADCEDGTTVVDALKVLQRDAGLSVVQSEGCPAIGSLVQAFS